MKVLNLIFGFGIGGIGACYKTYAKLGLVDNRLQMVNVCIYCSRFCSGRDELLRLGVQVVEIEGRNDVSWVRRLNELIEQERIDLIFTHGFNGPVVAMVCRWCGGKKVPIVCSYHGEYHPSTSARKLIAPIFNGVMHFVYKHFALGVLTCADYCKRFLIDCGVPAEKVKVVYNGIPDREAGAFKENNPHEAVVFLTVSRLEKVKGLDAMISGFAKAKKKHCDIMLHIVGDGTEMQALKECAESAGVSDSVRFLGYREDAAPYYQMADVYCLPSYSEAFPVGLLEAMRAGKPSIVSMVGGISEAVSEKEAVFVQPGNDESICEAICRLTKNWGFRDMLGRNARKRYVEEFTENSMMSGIASWLIRQGRVYV